MKAMFTTPEWVKGANIYEVNVRQYTPEGTFAAFEKDLPRLKDMEVAILWFMPIMPISQLKRQGSLGSYYAVADHTAINPEFGTLNDFQQLVQRAHDLGFKVIIDWVANHTGWDHIWAKKYPKCYKKDASGNFFDANGWQDVIDLDYTNSGLRKTMLAAMKFWLTQCDIDGFRCDMAHLVPLDFWEDARKTLAGVKKDLFWLGETENPIYHQVFDASYGWELLHTMEAIGQGHASISELERVLQRYSAAFPPDAIHLAFTSNHDENSHSGSEYERMDDAAKAFAVLTATWTNLLPLVYSGQELPNKKRLQFFEKDAIEWTGQNWLHDFYKCLLEARKRCAALHCKSTAVVKRIRTSADDKIFAFICTDDHSSAVVILHLSPAAMVKFTIEEYLPAGSFTSVFSGIEYQFKQPEQFELTAWGYLVFTQDGQV